MPWSWNEIVDELGEGDQTLVEQDSLIASFDFVEQHLGHAWVREQHRSGVLYTRVNGRKQPVGQSYWSGHVWAERVDAMARQLKALVGSRGLEPVLDRIREGDVAARSELFSAYLCMPEDLSARVELGVDATVDDRSVNMDFRIRRGDEAWVNAEVVSPEPSEKAELATSLLGELKSKIESVVPVDASVEIMMRREPQDRSELEEIVDAVRADLLAGNDSRKEITDLCVLIIRHGTSSLFVVEDHGEPNVPRLGVVGFQSGASAHGNVAIRLEFSDTRAEKILKQESKQLPSGAPSIIFVDGTRGSAAFSDWQQNLLGRFRRGFHTRISAVVMFMNPVIGGLLMWMTENPQAATKAPDWLMKRLRSWAIRSAS
jgi:hypothetical protein